MKDGMSEFLKTAYARNKVKDLHEAFIEYPVEDEWYQGEENYFTMKEQVKRN